MAPSRRLIPAILGIACLATAGRTEYRAEHYAPYLQDMRDRLAVLHAALEAPSADLDARRRAALEESLAALDTPSASMQEDLTLLVRAVAPLWSEYRDDAAMEGLAQYEMNLFWERLMERRTEVDLADWDPGIVSIGDYRMAKRRLSSFDHLRRKTVGKVRDAYSLRVRPWPWASSGRWLLRAARFLDEAADLLGANREFSFVQGTVTATLDGVPFAWRIATARRVYPFAPYPVLLEDPRFNYLEWKAWSIEPYTSLGRMNLFDPHAGDVYPKPVESVWAEPGVAIYFNPNFLDAYRDGQYGYYPDPNGYYEDPGGVERRIVLVTLDEDGGTASGTFRMTLFLSGGLSPKVLEGRFEITSGLRTYTE